MLIQSRMDKYDKPYIIQVVDGFWATIEFEGPHKAWLSENLKDTTYKAFVIV